jgi:Aldo/keto reductase family
MDQGKVLLCDLSKGAIGQDNARLLGSLIAMQEKLAALSRYDLPEEQRVSHVLYVEEAHNFIGDFESTLSETRKFNLHLALATESASFHGARWDKRILLKKIDARTEFDAKTDMRSGFPRFSPENVVANTPIVEFLKRFAEKKKATPAQISIAWLLAQKLCIVPIPGTRKMDHLRQNLGAVDVQLTPTDLREIETALSGITVHGGRMNEEQMRVVDQTA